MRAAGLFFAVTALLLAGGAARLGYIEAQRGAELRRAAAQQQTTRCVLPAVRGEILDTRGRVLAGTLHRPSVFADPAQVRDPRFAAYSVAPVLGLDPQALERRLAEAPPGTRFLWVKRLISDAELAAVERLVGLRRALGVQDEPTRVYPHGKVAPHVLGFVGMDLRRTPDGLVYEDLRGLEGLEAAYDELLAGTPGRQVLTVDVVRRPVRAPAEDVQPAVNGATLVLTIDTFIQQIAQEALQRAWERHRPEWATAVVLDPHSGEVLAMATVPDFDPAAPLPPGPGGDDAARRAALGDRWRNRAVADAYEPGSIFKPFVAAPALDEGLTRIDEVFHINGPTRQFGSRTIHDVHPYGSLALHEVISKSSNIGMGLLGARCQSARLYRYVRLFGFGDITGVGLPGEHAGLVQDLDRWNPSFSPQSVPIGQEIAATPIQIATAFGVFCNGGLLVRPRILRGVISAEGQTLRDESRPVVVRRVLDEQTAELFRRRALVEAVTTGTAKAAALKDYQVFGKTGTAQIAAPRGGGYLPGQYIASFVGGAPADRPRVVALVSLYRPKQGGYYGGAVAAPVVKDIIAETLAYMQVPPELSEEEEPARVTRRRRP